MHELYPFNLLWITAIHSCHYLDWPVSTDSGVIQHTGVVWCDDVIPAVENVGTRGVHAYVVVCLCTCIETGSLKSHRTTEPSSCGEWRLGYVIIRMDLSATNSSCKHQWCLVWTETAARWVGLWCQHTTEQYHDNMFI